MFYQPLLKTSNGILQFLSFDWLTGNGILAHISLTTNIVDDTRQRKQLRGSNIAILWEFLIKQLFYSCLLDMRSLYLTRRYTPRWLSAISYPTHAHRIRRGRTNQIHRFPTEFLPMADSVLIGMTSIVALRCKRNLVSERGH